MDYAEGSGVPLSFPEAPGTPLDALEGDWWLISIDNGDWTESVADVVLVAAPEHLQLDNTERGCALALAYADGQGWMPGRAPAILL